MTESERDLLVCIGIGLGRLLLSAPGGVEHLDTLVKAIEHVQAEDAELAAIRANPGRARARAEGG
jgi:hypothetical protein